MPERYEIEMSEATASRCDCCDGLTVRLTRLVYRDGDAFGIYFARYSNNHPDDELAVLVSLGEWGEGSDPSRRSAFFCRVRPTSDSYQVMLDDAGQSPWGDATIIGSKLSREEALGHPLKASAFAVVDEAFVKDKSLRGFLHRARCGDLAAPLDMSFHAPDDIVALDQQSKTRADVGRNFACLDGKRFFVRCLLPVAVERYASWNIGLWIEVSQTDHARAQAAWNDPQLYSSLRFTGRVANDVRSGLDLPLPLGSEVRLHVPDGDSPPKIGAPPSGELAELLSTPWARSDFENYAVARGLL